MTDDRTDTSQPPVVVATGDLDLRSVAASTGAGFGLAFAVMLASDHGIAAGLAAAIGAGLLLGWRFPGTIVLVGTGVSAAVLLYAMIGSLLAAGPGYEWQTFDELFDSIASITILAVLTVIYVLAARRRMARSAGERGNAVLAFGGLLAGVGAGVTLVVLLLTPAARSWEIPETTGWTAMQAAAMPDQAHVLSAGRVAVLAPDDPVGAGRPGPIAIVGVLNALGTTYDCRTVFDPWPGSPLFDGTVLEYGEVTISAGPAMRIHSTLELTGSDAYVYVLRRSRQVGLAHEDLCYLLAVVGEPGVPLDAKVPEALAASFRFR